ncbi:MAG TPA: nucleoside 2-deoxyribosyltransferase [Candidatus Moranbacteria bacterium]|nr:nucleoside 2-deoxyribosyltransferase [Candidatus Moranbacteria bacterium]
MIKIYFAGSIRGGRNDVNIYKKIIKHLQLLGKVLTEHVGQVTARGEVGKSDKYIYRRDLNWLSSSDLVIADVSSPSLGVGFEIAKAIELNKKVLCLFHGQKNKKLSAMISGCPNIKVGEYDTFDDAKKIIDKFYAGNSKNLRSK